MALLIYVNSCEAYVAPLGDDVDFLFEDGYTAPSGDDCEFEFCEAA